MRSNFVYENAFAIDSVSNTHIMNDCSSPIDYNNLETPREMKFNLSAKIISAKAIGVGKLPLLLKWKKNETIVLVKNMFYAPETEEEIIGANAFNVQFCASITLNTKSSHIFGRKLNI